MRWRRRRLGITTHTSIFGRGSVGRCLKGRFMLRNYGKRRKRVVFVVFPGYGKHQLTCFLIWDGLMLRQFGSRSGLLCSTELLISTARQVRISSTMLSTSRTGNTSMGRFG